MRTIVEEALESVVEPIVFAEALELLRAHRRAGRLLVIVSASPEEIVRPLASYLGVDDVVASKALIDEAGRYTGRMAFDAFGPAKVDAIHDLARRYDIDLAASYAYSDSATDIPMLETVGHPVAVNPDRELARLAVERGWEVRVFARPVQVRPTAGRTLPLAAAAGAAVALSGGAAWWWRARRTAGGAAFPALRRSANGVTLSVAAAPTPWGRWSADAANLVTQSTRELAGGDDTQGDEDGEQEELLHVGRVADGYRDRRRCPGTWWAPPPSKRLGRAIPVRRVRFPSTSAHRRA